MLGISGGEALFLLLIGAVLIGPARLPDLIRRGMQLFARAQRVWVQMAREVSSETDSLLQGSGLDDLNPVKFLQDDDAEPVVSYPPPPLTNVRESGEMMDARESDCRILSVDPGTVS